MLARQEDSYREEEEAFYSGSHNGDRPGTVRGVNRDGRVGVNVERPPLFSGISANEYARICAAARVKGFERGEMLCIEGESVQRVLLLISGCVKINKFGLNGTEVILRLGVPGDVIGAVDLFGTGMYCRTTQAFRLCEALVWDGPGFKALVERFPVLHRNMHRILGEHLLELEERFGEVATERVGSRVAFQLVRLAERIGRPVNGAVEILLSREEVAQMTGTTLFTVSRLLSGWEARGLVRLGRGTVRICDVQSLCAMCDECPPGSLATVPAGLYLEEGRRRRQLGTPEGARTGLGGGAFREQEACQGYFEPTASEATG